MMDIDSDEELLHLLDNDPVVQTKIKATLAHTPTPVVTSNKPNTPMDVSEEDVYEDVVDSDDGDSNPDYLRCRAIPPMYSQFSGVAILPRRRSFVPSAASRLSSSEDFGQDPD